MDLSRVKTKNSDLVVFVISADPDELLEMAKVMIMANQNPMGAHTMIKKEDSNSRIIIVNDKYFEQIGDSGLLEKKGETPVDKYINAHIVKWGIKPKGKKPLEKLKSKGKRTQIEVE